MRPAFAGEIETVSLGGELDEELDELPDELEELLDGEEEEELDCEFAFGVTLPPPPQAGSCKIAAKHSPRKTIAAAPRVSRDRAARRRCSA